MITSWSNFYTCYKIQNVHACISLAIEAHSMQVSILELVVVVKSFRS